MSQPLPKELKRRMQAEITEAIAQSTASVQQWLLDTASCDGSHSPPTSRPRVTLEYYANSSSGNPTLSNPPKDFQPGNLRARIREIADKYHAEAATLPVESQHHGGSAMDVLPSTTYAPPRSPGGRSEAAPAAIGSLPSLLPNAAAASRPLQSPPSRNPAMVNRKVAALFPLSLSHPTVQDVHSPNASPATTSPARRSSPPGGFSGPTSPSHPQRGGRYVPLMLDPDQSHDLPASPADEATSAQEDEPKLPQLTFPGETPAEYVCSMCKLVSDSLQTCCICYGIWYCSAKCQTEDWPLHQLLCQTFTTPCTAGPTRWTRPGARPVFVGPDFDHAPPVRVAFFHPTAARPELLRVRSDGHWVRDLLEEGAQNPNQTFAMRYLEAKVRGYTLLVMFRAKFHRDGSQINQPLAAATRTAGGGGGPGTKTEWRGPVILARCGQGEFQNLTMADFSWAVRFVAGYTGDPLEGETVDELSKSKSRSCNIM